MNREFAVACTAYRLQQRNFALLYGERLTKTASPAGAAATRPTLAEYTAALRKANGQAPSNYDALFKRKADEASSASVVCGLCTVQ